MSELTRLKPEEKWKLCAKVRKVVWSTNCQAEKDRARVKNFINFSFAILGLASPSKKDGFICFYHSLICLFELWFSFKHFKTYRRTKKYQT